MTIYMMTTKDKYELPLAVADSVGELAELTGVNPRKITYSLSKAKTRKAKRHLGSTWHKVEVEESND